MFVNIEAPDIGMTARFFDHARENIDQRRFARAVGAKQPEYLSARHVKADATKGLFATGIDFLERVDADCCVGH